MPENEHMNPDEMQDTTGMDTTPEAPAKKLPKSKQAPKAPPLKTIIEERKYELTFQRELLAMSPSSKSIYSDFVASKAPTTEVGEEELETIPDNSGKAKPLTIFHRDGEGVYLLNHQVKGFLKSAAAALRPIYDIPNLRSKVVAYVFVTPRYIWLAEDSAGQIERPLPTGRTGIDGTEQVCLSSSEFVPSGTKITIAIRKLPHAHVTWEVIEGCLDYGENIGIGAWRGAEYGTFTWERLE